MYQNYQVIKEINPHWYEQINLFERESASNHIDIIESEPGLDGNDILYLEKDGVDYRINSMYSPTNEAKRWAEQFEMKNVSNTVLLFGFGNGYFAREILSKLPKNDICLIYEPSPEIFLHVLDYYNIEDILRDNRVFIGIEGINEFDFHLLLKSVISATSLKSQIICSHPVYYKIFEKSHIIFKREIKEAMESAAIDFNTYTSFSKKMAFNTMKNLCHIDEFVTIEELHEKFLFDMPVIIVAAGPSVGENLEALRNIKGKALIVAVDRILDFLLDAGIEPDFVVTMDPGKQIKHFTTREVVDIPMFCLLHSQNQIIEKQKAKKILCYVGPFLESFFKKIKGTVPNMLTGQSVACFAYQIALSMGAEKIILVGQDLAYSGNVTHAGGVISNPYSGKVVLIEGVDGNQVESRYDWKEYAMWFKDMIYLHPEVKVYDTKTHGAKIFGSVTMPLEEAVIDAGGKSGCIGNIKAVLNSVSPAVSKEDTILLKEFIEKGIKDLELSAKKAKEGINVCYDMIRFAQENTLDSGKIDHKLKKINKIDDIIKKMPVYQLMDSIIVDYMKKEYLTVDLLSGDVNDDNIKVFKAQRSLFEAVIEAVKYIMPFMKELAESLN